MLPIRGRDAELAQILAAWDAARAGKPRLVVLSGEPGAGKTRLVQELYSELQARFDPPQPGHPEGYWPAELEAAHSGDGLVPKLPEGKALRSPKELPYLWWALRCSAGNQNNAESFTPFNEGLGQIDAHLSAMLATKLRGKAMKGLALSALFTVVSVTSLVALGGTGNYISAARDLKNFWGDFSKARDVTGVALKEKDSKTLEEALLRYFSAFNDQRQRDWPDVPVLLVLDDAQWADARSMAFLNRLLLTALEHEWQLMLLLTVRDSELAAQQASYAADPTRPVATLAELRASAVRRGGADVLVELPLQPQLPTAAAAAVIEDVVSHSGCPVVPATIAALQSRAGGQPCYLVQYARYVVERGLLDAAGAISAAEQLQDIPREIGALIDQRLELLPAEQRRLLEWGSVQGRRFAEELVRRMAVRLGGSADAATLALGQLRSAHRTLETLPPPPEELRRYEFAHRLLYERVAAQTTDELRGLVQDCMVELLAGWQERGQLKLLPEGERREALMLLAEEGLQRCCAPGSDSCWMPVALDAIHDLLELLVAINDYRAAEPWAEKLLEHLLRMDREHQWTGATCCAALDACGPGQQVLRIRGRYDLRLQLLEVQLKAAEAQGDVGARGEVLRNIGSVHEDRGDFKLAQEFYTRSLECYDQAPDDRERAKTLKYLANSYLYMDHARAAELYQQCYELQRAIGDERGAARTLMGIALSRHHAQDLEGALQLYRDSIAKSEELGDFHAAALAYNNLALLHMERGEIDAAEPLLQRNRETLLSIGDDYGAAMSLGNLGVIEELRGNYARAIELGEQCLATEERLGEQHGMAETLLHLARSHAALGQHELATKRLQMAIARYERAGNTKDIEEARALLAQLADAPAPPAA
jgi:tetratricopeptide (TPR) repeat protein